MKILHVNKFFDPRRGAEMVLHATIERQRRAGHEVHVFSTRSPQNFPSDDTRYFVERFDYAISEGMRKDMRKAASFMWNREAKRAIARMLAELRPDVIHLHNIYHHLSSSILDPIRASRIPCVQTLHDYKLACPNYRMFTEGSPCERCKGGNYLEAVKHQCLTSSFAGNLLASLEMGMTKARQSYERTVRAFICPSEFIREKMIAWGEPAGKMIVIPNAVDLPERVASRDGGYFLSVGSLSIEKGLETLLRAAARVPEAKIQIAGIGPEEGRLRSLATTLGLSNVEFLGFVRRADLDVVRSSAAALVHPSISYDNAPLAVLEAMAAGMPVIGSRIGGIPEQIADAETGFLVEPADVGAWAEALSTFCTMPESDRRAMGDAGRARAAELFSWEQHLARLDETYRRAGAVG